MPVGVAAYMKRAGKASVPVARAIETVPSSNGCRNPSVDPGHLQRFLDRHHRQDQGH